MRVLVDTSVWSLALRKKGPVDHTSVKKLSALLVKEEDIVITGTILQEVLQAFRSPATVKKVKERFEAIPLLVLDRADYAEAAAIHRRCASKGIAASTTDCQIAQAAIRNDCFLLTADKDFEYIVLHSSLKLA